MRKVFLLLAVVLLFPSRAALSQTGQPVTLQNPPTAEQCKAAAELCKPKPTTHRRAEPHRAAEPCNCEPAAPAAPVQQQVVQQAAPATGASPLPPELGLALSTFVEIKKTDQQLLLENEQNEQERIEQVEVPAQATNQFRAETERSRVERENADDQMLTAAQIRLMKVQGRVMYWNALNGTLAAVGNPIGMWLGRAQFNTTMNQGSVSGGDVSLKDVGVSTNSNSNLAQGGAGGQGGKGGAGGNASNSNSNVNVNTSTNSNSNSNVNANNNTATSSASAAAAASAPTQKAAGPSGHAKN